MAKRLIMRQTEDDIAKWNAWNMHNGPKYPHAKVVQYAFRNFPSDKRASTHVLDAGCGNGVNGIFCLENGFKVSGFDVSSAAIEGLRKNESINHEHQFKVGSIDAIPFEASRFDFAMSIGVLDCVPKSLLQPAFEEFFRVLKPGGKLLVVLTEEGDFRLNQDHGLPIVGASKSELRELIALFNWQSYFIDHYQTSHEGGKYWQKDLLITAVK